MRRRRSLKPTGILSNASRPDGEAVPLCTASDLGCLPRSISIAACFGAKERRPRGSWVKHPVYPQSVRGAIGLLPVTAARGALLGRPRLRPWAQLSAQLSTPPQPGPPPPPHLTHP